MASYFDMEPLIIVKDNDITSCPFHIQKLTGRLSFTDEPCTCLEEKKTADKTFKECEEKSKSKN